MAGKLATIVVITILGLLVSLQFKAAFSVRQALDPQTQDQLALVVGQTFADNRKLSEQLKRTQDELNKLQTSASSTRSQRQALETKEIEAELILGRVAVEGEGVEIAFDKGLTVSQAVDLTNALRSSGSEAIAINGKRVLWNTGLDVQLLTGAAAFKVIGPKQLLGESLKRRGGILGQLGQPTKLVEHDNLKLPPM